MYLSRPFKDIYIYIYIDCIILQLKVRCLRHWGQVTKLSESPPSHRAKCASLESNQWVSRRFLPQPLTPRVTANKGFYVTHRCGRPEPKRQQHPPFWCTHAKLSPQGPLLYFRPPGWLINTSPSLSKGARDHWISITSFTGHTTIISFKHWPAADLLISSSAHHCHGGVSPDDSAGLLQPVGRMFPTPESILSWGTGNEPYAENSKRSPTLS